MSKVSLLSALSRRASRKLRKLTNSPKSKCNARIVDGTLYIESDCVSFLYRTSDVMPIVPKCNYQRDNLTSLFDSHMRAVEQAWMQELTK